MLQLIRGDRFAKQVALVRGTALHAKKCQLVASLHSFGHDVKLECATHADDRSYDGGINCAELEIFNERPIDLERVEGKPLKIRER